MMKKPEFTTYHAGDLEVLALQAHDPHGPHIIMLHGYGATAEDLLSLAEYVNAPANTTWIFPNAPHLVTFDQSYTGRSWFSFDMEKLNNVMRLSLYDEFAKAEAENISYAAELIQDLLKRIPCPLDKVVIGGFSQGAMLATHVALKTEENLAGLAVFSGSVINEDMWLTYAKKKEGLSFFQSHGEFDNVINVNLAYRLEKLFKDAGMLGKLHLFQDGHTIPEEVLSSFGEFLIKQLE